MAKRIPKVIVDGKSYNRCPICGQHCTDACWWSYRHCGECERLLKQGHDVERVRSIRGDQASIAALINAQEIPTTTELASATSGFKYDFIKTFPKGIQLFVSDKDEAAVLRDAYSDYEHYNEKIPEFATVMGGVLQARLEQFRISRRLADVNITATERKNETELHAKLSEQINKSTAALDSMKAAKQSQGVDVLTEEFSKMAKYMAEHQHEYQGIGVCPDCQQRIIFTTVFPTFLARYAEVLTEQLDLLTKTGAYDMISANELARRMHDVMTSDTVADTYTIKHKRKFEATLP